MNVIKSDWIKFVSLAATLGNMIPADMGRWLGVGANDLLRLIKTVENIQ